MSKKNLLFLCAIVSATLSFAQQDPQFTQNMFMKLPVNPGYAGTRGALCATAAYRTQWVGFPGAPKTFFLTADMPVYELSGGLGLTILKDKLGNFNFTHLRGAYSYHQAVNRGIGLLGLGVELGILQSAVENNWMAPDGTTGLDDTGVPNSSEKKTNYDVGLGAYYRTNTLYFGISTSHIPGNMEHLAFSYLDYNPARHYYLMTGYNCPIVRGVELRSSLFIKSDLTVSAFDFHCDLLYNNSVWGGFSYRLQDAIAPTVGVAFRPLGEHSASLLKIGYSYDLGLSDMKTYHNNTHEIVVNYCIQWNKPQPSHINPRLMVNGYVREDRITQPHWLE